MCIQAGEPRFKFAADDKADFLNLFNWTWPYEIGDKKVEVIKPYSLADCYLWLDSQQSIIIIINVHHMIFVLMCETSNNIKQH
jgi:hypothetical protein